MYRTYRIAVEKAPFREILIMNHSPLVTVILTSFNHGKFIGKAIDSVLNQTYSNFELIIWDDCSQDNSWEVIQSYTDKRIRTFRNDQQSRGVYGINKAISEIAKGEYIAIHHSDDEWREDKLKSQVDFFNSDSEHEYGACFTYVEVICENDDTSLNSEHFYSEIFEQPNRTREEWFTFFATKGNALCHPSVLLRKSIFEKCGLYRYGIPQLGDYDLWFRLIFEYNIHILPSPLVKFRVLDNSRNTSAETEVSLSRMPMEAFCLYLSTLTKYKDCNPFKLIIDKLSIAHLQPSFHVALMYLQFHELQQKPVVKTYLKYIDENTDADFFNLRYLTQLNNEIKTLTYSAAEMEKEHVRAKVELEKIVLKQEYDIQKLRLENKVLAKQLKCRKQELVKIANEMKRAQWGIK